jgi:hypothetical protein
MRFAAPLLREFRWDHKRELFERISGLPIFGPEGNWRLRSPDQLRKIVMSAPPRQEFRIRYSQPEARRLHVSAKARDRAGFLGRPQTNGYIHVSGETWASP